MRHVSRSAWPVVLALLSAVVTGAMSPLAAQPAPNVREGWVESGRGVRLFYRMVGTGRDTVVVLHGGPGFTLSYIEPDLEPLATHHTLFYDQRGAGRSTLVADSASLDAQRFAEDLEAVRRSFGLEQLTLLGHSWDLEVPDRFFGAVEEFLRSGQPSSGASRKK